MSPPIRVLHVVEALGVGGGIEHGIANLIERMDPRGFEHTMCAVFRLGPHMERYPADRVRVVCLKQEGRKLPIQVTPLAKLIRELAPDIVHSRNWCTLEAVIAARWVGSRAGMHSEHGGETNPSAEPSRRRWLRRVGFELAHRVFSVSYQLRETLSRSTGFRESRIDVIHNGVDLDRFRPAPASRLRFRQELGIPEDAFCIGCLGRLNRIKDYPTMLRAAERIAESSDSWRLLIAGGGPELAALTEFVTARPALQGRIHFLGATQTQRVPDFLNAIDAYVLPSVWEGISNSLLEAMAAGLPVIASETGGNPEVIVDGESGFLFPVGDWQRLAELLNVIQRQQHLREGLASQALRRVAIEFSLSTMVRKYEQMYEDLLPAVRAA
jgi:sugar transferase (PEP-CTERM/EpsH1 system associated)